MAMETRLSLRQSQRVVMTPLLQHAIQRVQLSTLERQEVVQKELLENPLLEEVQPETAEQPEGKDAPPDVPTAPPAEPLSSEAAPAPTTERQTDDLPFDLTAVMFDDHEERSLVAQEDREDLPFENMVRSVSSLTDHLDEQLRYASDDPLARRIGTEIIGNLDEDGYLRASDEEIAQRCETTPEEVQKVLKLVHTFDPPGVAARSIQECLLIQLKADPNPDPVSVEIVEDHFEDLSRRRYPDIARAQAAPGPDHGIGRGDHGPGAEARAALRRQRLAVHRTRRGRPQDGQRVRSRAQRGRDPTAARDLALSLAAAQFRRRRGATVRGPEAALRAVADQVRGSAPAHAAQGDPIDREVPARVPRQGPALPAPAVAARRGRGHRHARVDHQPCHHEQVRRDAPGTLRAEVLLPLRHRLRRRRDGLVSEREKNDPGPARERRPIEAAVRSGSRSHFEGPGPDHRPPDRGEIPRGAGDPAVPPAPPGAQTTLTPPRPPCPRRSPSW